MFDVTFRRHISGYFVWEAIMDVSYFFSKQLFDVLLLEIFAFYNQKINSENMHFFYSKPVSS
jgi:hypothetical protein